MTPLFMFDFWMGIGAAAAYVLAAIAIGSWRSRADRPLTRRLLLGVILFSAWPPLISSTGHLPSPLTAAPLLLAFFAPWRLLGQHARSLVKAWRHEGPAGLVLAAGLGSAALLALVAALHPSCGMDALAYHLGLPNQYLLRGSVAPFATGGYVHYFQAFEFAVLPLLAIDASGQSIQLVNAILLVASARIAYRLAIRSGSHSAAAALAAASLLASPILVSAIALTKNDLLAVALTLAAAEILFDEGAAPALGALFAGAALAVKPTAFFAVAPILGFTLRRNGRHAAGLLAAALLPGAWIARNLLYSGHALPDAFFANTAFADFSRESGPGALGALHHLALSFLHRYIDGTDGPLGALLLILNLLALTAIRSRPRSGLWLLLAIAGWSLLGHAQARYLVPALAVGSALGAARLRSRAATLALIPVLAFTLAYNAWRLETDFRAFSWLSGSITREEYFRPWLDSWPVQNAGRERLPRDARVIAVGEGELFPLGRVADYDAFWEPSRVLAWAHECGHDTVALHAALRSRGYTHLLDNPRILDQLIASGRTPAPACARDRETLHSLLKVLPVAVEVPGNAARIYALEP